MSICFVASILPLWFCCVVSISVFKTYWKTRKLNLLCILSDRRPETISIFSIWNQPELLSLSICTPWCLEMNPTSTMSNYFKEYPWNTYYQSLLKSLISSYFNMVFDPLRQIGLYSWCFMLNIVCKIYFLYMTLILQECLPMRMCCYSCLNLCCWASRI